MDFIKQCRECDLHKNQLPLLDKVSCCDVIWVGLSSKIVKDIDNDIPLSNNTNTGKIIEYIEELFPNLLFYKTNLVKCVPLNEDKKLRYPFNIEKKACYSNLEYEISILQPKLVFMLGAEVSKFILDSKRLGKFNLDYNFNYFCYQEKNMNFIPIHHPSYMSIYKRKYIGEYVNGIKSIIDTVHTDSVSVASFSKTLVKV